MPEWTPLGVHELKLMPYHQRLLLFCTCSPSAIAIWDTASGAPANVVMRAILSHLEAWR
jgi:hypothetical protein